MKKDIMKFLKKKDNAVILISLSMFILIFGILSGIASHYIQDRFFSTTTNIVRDEDPRFEELYEAYDILTSDYYTDLKHKELVEGAIKGMAEAIGDPYTTYLNAEETKSFDEAMQGDYEGIGAMISVNDDGKPMISQPFKDSPAMEAGLQPMDIISKVNGEDVIELSTEVVASKIKGPAGTDVVITIIRDGTEQDITITRDSITIQYVTFEMLDDNIGYIDIESFALNTYTQFANAILDLEEDGMESLIIDVRNNSGGYLDIVTLMSSVFLDENKVIYQLETQEETTKVYSKTKAKKDYTVVVLVNQYSASASEILAGAMKDSYGSEVVGVTTYGKGTVQRTEDLTTGGMIKYTIEKWLTPAGDWIHETGLEPTIEVEMEEDYFDDPTNETDNQLQRAIIEAKK